MNRTAPRSPGPATDSPRRRAPRPSTPELDLFGAVPERRSAAAMDDAAEAERLIDDLLVLVECGLVEVVSNAGQLRYRPTAAGRA